MSELRDFFDRSQEMTRSDYQKAVKAFAKETNLRVLAALNEKLQNSDYIALECIDNGNISIVDKSTRMLIEVNQIDDIRVINRFHETNDINVLL